MIQTVALTSYPEPTPALDATPSPIPQDHDTIFVDTLVGHRAHAKFLSRLGQRWAKDVVNHNSHVLVIRKREVAEPAALPPHPPHPHLYLPLIVFSSHLQVQAAGGAGETPCVHAHLDPGQVARQQDVQIHYGDGAMSSAHKVSRPRAKTPSPLP